MVSPVSSLGKDSFYQKMSEMGYTAEDLGSMYGSALNPNSNHRKWKEIIDDDLGLYFGPRVIQLLEKADLMDFDRTLGKGGFGSVYSVKGKGKYAGKELAVKLIETDIYLDPSVRSRSIQEVKDQVGEVAALLAPKGKHLGRAYGMILFGQKKGASSEEVHYVEKSDFLTGNYHNTVVLGTVTRAQEKDLSRVLSAQKLSYKAIAGYGKKMAEAIQALHENGILHRDIKPENILVKPKQAGKSPYRIKLADLGLSADLRAKDKAITGTPLFMAPEVYTGKYGAAADWFSFGATLYVMALRRHPSYLKSWQSLILLFDKKDKIVNPKLKDLLFSPTKGLLAQTPERRYTGKEVLSHPFFIEATTSRATSR